MLDQLVESRDEGKENRRREGFLLTTFLGTASLFATALVYSLFSYNLAMGGERLEISNLVAPVVADAPPAPEPAPQREKPAVNEASKSVQPVRQANIQRADESPVKAPAAISSAPSELRSRPNVPFTVGRVDFDPSGSGANKTERSSAGTGSPLGLKTNNETAEVEKEQPPVIKTVPPKTESAKTEPRKPPVQSGGVVNGKARNLVTPTYPPTARAVRAFGTVNVQVLIDEEGNVVSAKAVSGHALLQDAAVKAARQSKFTPTLLSNQKVKVTGVIVYNFTAP